MIVIKSLHEPYHDDQPSESYFYNRDGSLMMFPDGEQAMEFLKEHEIDPHSDWIEYEEVQDETATG